ncbi:MAG: PD40 domain-containing protein [Gemmatimonadetes bacterium]|nr:PD40 domain-containing protein [Gemmatimonadota bacterium]
MTLRVSSARLRRLRPGAAALALAMLCAGGLASAPPVASQTVPFGKNKVQYTEFDWHLLSGPNVDVYYYPEEETLARVALAYAEESFEALTILFNHRAFRRVPLIIYSSHQHFEQTNVAPGFIPEGVAGFTEFLKRRIALPFNGSYSDFRHTIRHELVHFFQLSKLSRTFSQYPRQRRIPIPLWWTEGLAERWSSPQDSEDEMYVRDLVLSGRLPALRQLSYAFGFLVYPLGGEIHRYLGERFGYDRVARLYEDLWKYPDFESALEGVYGVPLDQLERELEFEFRRRHFPVYSDRVPIDVGARPLLLKGGLNFKPVPYSTTGDSLDAVLFMSPRTGYASIYSASVAEGEGSVREVVQGERSTQFESLHFFESRLDVHGSRKLVLVSKYLERDALVVWDLDRRSVVGRYQFPDLVGMSSPAWAPDGRSAVFAGLSTAGTSDLYVLEFTTQRLARLTNDYYDESDPDISPDGRWLVFSSDRTPFGRQGATNLFLLDLETRAIRYLTYGPWRDGAPRWSPDGAEIVFASDRDGTYDLYAVRPDGTGRRLTRYVGGAFDPDWLDGRRAVVFTGFHRGRYGIYVQRVPPEDSAGARLFALPDLVTTTQLASTDWPGPAGDAGRKVAARPAPAWHWSELRDTLQGRASSRRYRTRFGLDFAAGEAVYAPGFAAGQGAQLLATDMLGNHILFLGLSSQQVADNVSDLLDSFSGQLLYLNLSRRLNWGVGGFRFSGRFVDRAFRNVFDEQTHGGYFLASYPFSKFRRIELATVVERSDRKDAFDIIPFLSVDQPPDTIDLTRKGTIVSNFLSYVFDNSLWLPTGPVDGMRLNLTGGLVTDLSAARAENYILRVDARRYFRTSLRSAYAVRVFGYYSDGAIPGRTTLGGTHSLRLYPRFGLFGSRAWLLSQEWRFPLTNRITIGFPFGDLTFPSIQSAFFFDLAQIWLEGQEPSGVWGSWGTSFRMPLGAPLVLRLDVGRRFTLGNLPTESFLEGFGGTKVDFFFGYNY